MVDKIYEKYVNKYLKRISELYDIEYNVIQYYWKSLDNGDFRPLDMAKTLEQNGIYDERKEFERLRIDSDFYVPVLHLYYNDDLTVA